VSSSFFSRSCWLRIKYLFLESRDMGFGLLGRLLFKVPGAGKVPLKIGSDLFFFRDNGGKGCVFSASSSIRVSVSARLSETCW